MLFNNKYRDSFVNDVAVGDKVILSGWVRTKRNHGGLLFIDLRDDSGVVQLVFNQDTSDFEDASKINLESVIKIEGSVIERSELTINEGIKNGHLEVMVMNWEIIADSEVLPFTIIDENPYPEEILLKFRFLDLRSADKHQKILFRSKVINFMRIYMQEKGFIEFNTPILTASSPEGARDFLVPSRLHNGKFYALPQAPQVFKQMLMVSGFERYFQIAPCFRDEDARSDRSPTDFYQLDIEMSFVEQEDVLRMSEKLIMDIFKHFGEGELMFEVMPRITYAESMLIYGTDKPDLRNDLKIFDVTNIFAELEIDLYLDGIKKGMVVRGIPVPGAVSKSRKFFDQKVDYVKANGGSGLGYLIFEETGVRGPLAKFFNDKQLSSIKEVMKICSGDAALFYFDYEVNACKTCGLLRNLLGEELALIDDKKFALCWVYDFPYFEKYEDGSIGFSHNPFSMPHIGSLENFDIDNHQDALACQYDVVCNGIEIASGAMRNNSIQLIEKACAIVGYNDEQVQKIFGGLLRAFRYGAPPHGGIAFGIERLLMILCREKNIRSLICFPMNQAGEDPLLGAPSEVDKNNLQELGIQIKPKKRQ